MYLKSVIVRSILSCHSLLSKATNSFFISKYHLHCNLGHVLRQVCNFSGWLFFTKWIVKNQVFEYWNHMIKYSVLEPWNYKVKLLKLWISFTPLTLYWTGLIIIYGMIQKYRMFNMCSNKNFSYLIFMYIYNLDTDYPDEKSGRILKL